MSLMDQALPQHSSTSSIQATISSAAPLGGLPSPSNTAATATAGTGTGTGTGTSHMTPHVRSRSAAAGDPPASQQSLGSWEQEQAALEVRQ